MLIAREHEIQTLLSRCEDTRSPRGGTVLVSGEAGVGKTSVAEYALADSGLRCYRAIARQRGAASYAPIVAVLRDWLVAKGGSPPEATDTHSAVKSVLALTDGSRHEEELEDHERFVGSMLRALLEISADQPTALLLDDLQWADSATIDLLPVLDERIRRAPLLVVAIYRSDEIDDDHDVRRLRAELQRRKRLDEIQVRPFDASGTRALVERMLGNSPSGELVTMIHERTEGIPLFVEELTNALVEQHRLREGPHGIEAVAEARLVIPDRVRDAVLLRTDNLSARAHAQLEVAAIMGNEVNLAELAQLSATEEGIDELLNTGFLIEKKEGVAEFRHSLVRQAIGDAITWSRRRKMNRDIAGFLEGAEASPERVAGHWLAANESESARHALVQALRGSCRVYAYRDAVTVAWRALEIWPPGVDGAERLEVLQQLSHCAQVTGLLGDAERAYTEILESPRVKEDPAARAETHRSIATVLGLRGMRSRAIRAHTAAGRCFAQAGMMHAAAVELTSAADYLAGSLQLAAAARRIAEAIELAERAGNTSVTARTLGVQGCILAMQGRKEAGLESVRTGLSLALERNLTTVASELYWRLGTVFEYSSDFNEAGKTYAVAVEQCQTRGEETTAFYCLGCMGYVLFRTGEWKTSISVCERLSDTESSPPPSSAASACLNVALISAFRGKTRTADRYLAKARPLVHASSHETLHLLLRWGDALLYELKGANEQAAEEYRELLERWRGTQDRHDVIPALVTGASFFERIGAAREIAICAEALAQIASGTANLEAIGALAFTLGESAMLSGRYEEATDQFDRASRRFANLGLPVEQIRAGYRHGVALLRSGALSESVRILRHMYQRARRLGLRPMCDAIKSELEAMGEPVAERRTADAPERAERAGLTARQLEVVQLIAQGATTKEIAETLFLSARTVEMHVSNLLDRLDCHSRSEAVSKAAELGLLE